MVVFLKWKRLVSVFIVVIISSVALQKRSYVLSPSVFLSYIVEFNQRDDELYVQAIPNKDAWKFLSDNIPFFECPDKELEQTYYFRWWMFRKHIKLVPNYPKPFHVVTEFLPNVSWAGIHNTISCAAAHHFREGRWLHNNQYLDDYARFWIREGNSRQYSFWMADSFRARSLVTGNKDILIELLPGMVRNFETIMTTNMNISKDGREKGLYFNTDNRDGMELSIGGFGGSRAYRPTLNSYQYGEAFALAKIFESLNQMDRSRHYTNEAKRIKSLVERRLWDKEANFFKVLSYKEPSSPVDVRELHGYTPWYFNLPSQDKMVAWEQLMDPKGFLAPFGLTTAEQRHPQFAIQYSKAHECLWNGPTWPYATSITLTALANVLNNVEDQKFVTTEDYFFLLRQYARSHRRTVLSDNGHNETIFWLDENLNPYNGDWISRTLLSSWVNGSWSKAKGGRERGKDYNHSTFVDLIISGLIGIRPRSKDILVVSPLVPVDAWDYFCLDGVLYRQRILTVIWDRTGERYGRGAGFQVLVDGKRLARAETLTRLRLRLPPLGPISASAPVEVSISERGTPSGAGAGAGADLGALQ